MACLATRDPVRGAFAALLVALSASAASGQVVAEHFAVDAWGSGTTLYFDPPTLRGDPEVAIGPLSGGSGGSFPAEAEGRATGRAPGALLGARAASAAPPAASQFEDRFASAAGAASWSDVLFARGPAPPDELRLSFAVDGVLTVTEVGESTVSFRPNVTRAALGVNSSPDLSAALAASPLDLGVLTTAPIPSGQLRATVAALFGAPPVATAGAGAPRVWDATDFRSSDGLAHDFSGTFSLATPLRSALQLGTPDPGYLVSVSLTAGTSVRGGAASAAFLGTLRLTGVSLPDGSPLPPGLEIWFESGLPVPEPGAGAAGAAAALSLWIAARVRRSAPVVGSGSERRFGRCGSRPPPALHPQQESREQAGGEAGRLRDRHRRVLDVEEIRVRVVVGDPCRAGAGVALAESDRFRGVSRKHLQRQLDESVYRFDGRERPTHCALRTAYPSMHRIAASAESPVGGSGTHTGAASPATLVAFGVGAATWKDVDPTP